MMQPIIVTYAWLKLLFGNNKLEKFISYISLFCVLTMLFGHKFELAYQYW